MIIPDFLHMRKQRRIPATISTFVFASSLVQSLYILIPKFQAVAVQPGLCRTWSETPKTRFLATLLNNVVPSASVLEQ